MQEGSSIEAAFDVGKNAWPGVSLSAENFAARATSSWMNDGALLERATDLFLACACAHGDLQAIWYFEAEIVSQLDLYVARFALSKTALDEVRQRVRVKLLVGEKAAIAEYQGRGPLAGWVRMIAVRTALDVIAAEGGQVRGEIDLLDFTIAPGDDPELTMVKNLYRDRFNAALEKALRAQSSRDRTLLRLFIVDGLNIEAIGAIYHVHRATVARWFVAIRARVIDSVRMELDLRATPSASEMRSLMALLRDEFYLSANRMLASETAPNPPR